MPAAASPMLERRDEETFAFVRGEARTVAEFRRDVARLARRLPDAEHLINACEDRYGFVVSFCAALAAGRTNLLPAARTPETYDHLRAAYPGAAVVDDDTAARHADEDVAPGPLPRIADAHPAAIAFTSGSTGAPRPNEKRWGALLAGARMHARRLELGPDTVAPLVATVPPWHMYGLEWSVLVALVAPVALYCGESFYPADLQRAFESVSRPRVLVTTPVHLRAMLRSAAGYPALARIVCATAPLDTALAEQAEQALEGRVLEIYGCTETGTLAHRRPTAESAWSPFPGFRLRRSGDVTVAESPLLPEPVALADRLELTDDGRFHLRGRIGDVVKVAGKRASLGELTARLLALPGVEDAVVVAPDDPDAEGERLSAFVVAPSLAAEEIRRRLAAQVDPALVPRPLRRVPELPRSATGKLTRDAMRRLQAEAAAAVEAGRGEPGE